MSPLAPQHVVFIPDGNRRWAKREGLSALEGHRQGMDRGRELLHRAIDLGIPYASFWGMSIDNFTKRSKIEVAGLVTIFQKLFEDFLDDEDLVKKEVRVRVLGRWAEKFPASAANVIKELEEKTKHHTAFNFTLLLAYNGTDEMLSAVSAIAKEAAATGKAQAVTAQMLKSHLFTKDLPPADLVIRSGGDPHLSNGFMMWDTADAELYFTNKYWPEFNGNEFDKALAWYASRERRMGK
ncbi:MAG: di-trans,poly-cis-decaprenylcistransferase [Candidatus Andersenbacteria bacterium]|nr:di-trans,poly-cis-decaprenylcistransferase [Candidatus Andersenbacteria bacterium]